MASFANSFALLEGDAPSTSSGVSKKKKSKKNKKPPASALPPSGQNDSATAAPRSDDTPADDGFQVAGKISRRNSAGKASSPVRKKRSLMEAIVDVETAAGQAPFRDKGARVAQWNSWRQQVCKILNAHACYECETLQITHMSPQVTDKNGETFSDGATFKQVQLLLQHSTSNWQLPPDI